MGAYGASRFGDVPRARRASDPPGLHEGRQARNLDRRDPDPVLDAARETSPRLWGSAPPRPADDFDRAIAAVARPGLFDPNASRAKLKQFIDRGREQPPARSRSSNREAKVAAVRSWLARLSDEQRDEFRWSGSYSSMPVGQQRIVDLAYEQISDDAQAEYEAEFEYEDRIAEERAEDDIPAAQLLAEIGYQVNYEPVYDGGGYYDDQGWSA